MKRGKLILLAGIILSILVAVYATVVKFAKTVDNGFHQATLNSKLDSNRYTDNLPIEYAHLLKNIGKADSILTDFSKRRNAVSEIIHNKKIYLLVYKIDTLRDHSINNLIKPNLNSSPISSHENYSGYTNDSPFQVNFKEREKPVVSNVFFNISADQIESVKKNDSTYYFYSPATKYFSISYKKRAEEDIYGEIKDNFGLSVAPAEIIFMIRNNNLYFIFLTSNSSDAKLEHNFLLDLVKT